MGVPLLALALLIQDKKEKALCKLRERYGLVDQINLDLTYAVCFNLANCYHQNGMKKEVMPIMYQTSACVPSSPMLCRGSS